MRGVGLTRRERMLGGVLLACELAVFPVVVGNVFALAEGLLGCEIGNGLRDVVYYTALFVLTLLVFGGYWRRNWKAVRAGRFFPALGLGLVAFYGADALGGWLLRKLPLPGANLNDGTVLARLEAAPGITVFVVVLLAPVIEETLFRGYVFGVVGERSRGGAYVVSSVLWALAHVWPYAAAGDWRYLVMVAPYLAPGVVMGWTYERSGSLWGSVFLHSLVNAIAVGRIFL